MSLAIDEALVLLARDSAAAGASSALLPPPEDLVVFLSDGDSEVPDEELDDALARAVEANVTVHAVGVGGSEGTGMVLPRGTYQLGGPVTDARGAPGVTRIDETVLRRLATGGGGLYAHADRPADMTPLVEELGSPTEAPDPDPAEAPPIWAAYDWSLLLGSLALACVLLESLIGITLPRLASVRTREAT